MSFALAILELALSLVKAQTKGNVQQGATVAGILVQIIQKALAAYQAHTGESLDPALIKPEPVV